MPARKMRKVPRRSMITRKGYKRSPYRKKSSSEVKHFGQFISSPTPIENQNPGSNTNLLYANGQANFAYADGALAGINEGTQSNQRIGKSIYVKFMVIKVAFYICPAAASTETFSTVGIRLIVHNSRTNQASIPNFFSSLDTQHFLSYVDRSYRNVYYDKHHFLNTGYPLTGATRGGEGNLKVVTIRIPFGRVVEYTGSGGIKNDRDVIQLAWVAWSPNITDNGAQLACCKWITRIYYTDD